MKKSTAIMLLVVSISGCEPLADARMHLINDSGDTLWYYYTTVNPLPEKSPFQRSTNDGGLPDTNAVGVHSRQFLPYENKVMLNLGKWDAVIANPYSDSSITFFTFSTQTVRTTPWSTIRQKKLYKSYKFTLNQIKAKNWQLKMTPK